MCTCIDTRFPCQRSGNHCTLLLSCFFSSFAFKHQRQQIVQYKHTLVLTGSVSKPKQTRSLFHFKITHKYTLAAPIRTYLGRLHLKQNWDSGWSYCRNGFSQITGGGLEMNPGTKKDKVEETGAHNPPPCSFWTSFTCTESKKVRLVGVSLQQGGDASSHPLVAFVDELLSEVAVDLQGRRPVVSRQRAVYEMWQLSEREERGVRFSVTRSKQDIQESWKSEYEKEKAGVKSSRGMENEMDWLQVFGENLANVCPRVTWQPRVFLTGRRDRKWPMPQCGAICGFRISKWEKSLDSDARSGCNCTLMCLCAPEWMHVHVLSVWTCV